MKSSATLAERLWLRVVKTDGCWLWQGAKSGGKYGGYGLIRDGRKLRYVHILAYELLVGQVPDGHELDHTCRVHNCCNPDHLDPVPHLVNVLRGTGTSAEHARKVVCLRGHVFDHIDPRGWRKCNACARELYALHKAARR